MLSWLSTNGFHSEKVRPRITGHVWLRGMNLYELSEHEVQDMRGGRSMRKST
jgi:hypothetical protein